MSTGPFPMAMVCCEAIICDDRCWQSCHPSAIEVDPSTGPSGSCCPGLDGTYAIDQGAADCSTTHLLRRAYEIADNGIEANGTCGSNCAYTLAAYGGDVSRELLAVCDFFICQGAGSVRSIVTTLRDVSITITLSTTLPRTITVSMLYRYRNFVAIQGSGCFFNSSGDSSNASFQFTDTYSLVVDCEAGYDNSEITYVSRGSLSASTGTISSSHHTDIYGNITTFCDPLVLRLRA